METTPYSKELLPLQKQPCNVELTLYSTAFEACTVVKNEIRTPPNKAYTSECLASEVYMDTAEG